jgi:hypothetical protein
VRPVGQWRAGRSASLSEEYLKGKSKGKRRGDKMEEEWKSEDRSQKTESRNWRGKIPSKPHLEE